MSDTYNAAEPQPGVTVNVAAPQPAAATIPTATEDQVDRFLGTATPTAHPGAGSSDHYVQDPQGGGFISGVIKGGSQQVLGALSLLPGIGNWFTRESYLGQLAYAPSRRGSESVGEFFGTVAPWIAGGEALASARGIGALTSLSPSLARVLAGAERIAPKGRVFSVTPEGEATATSVGGGIARLKPTIARGAAVGAVAGAAQEPEGDTSYTGRIPAAVGGALGGAALTKLGLGKAQQDGVNKLVTGLATLMGAEAGANVGSALGIGPLAGGGIGGLGALLISMYGLHNMGLSVRQVDTIAPLIADYAKKLAHTSATAPVGAAIGKTINEIGERT